MRRAAHGDVVLVALLHPDVEAAQVAYGAVYGTVVHAPGVDEWLLAEQDMAVAVVGNLVALGEHAPDNAVVVHGPAELVLMDVGVVVEADAAPGRRTFPARLVGVIHPGVADNVEGALCVELGEGVEDEVCQGAPVELVGGGGQVHRAVVEGHGADTFRSADALDAPRVADVRDFLREKVRGLQDLFPRFPRLDYQGHLFAHSSNEIVKHTFYGKRGPFAIGKRPRARLSPPRVLAGGSPNRLTPPALRPRPGE